MPDFYRKVVVGSNYLYKKFYFHNVPKLILNIYIFVNCVVFWNKNLIKF